LADERAPWYLADEGENVLLKCFVSVHWWVKLLPYLKFDFSQYWFSSAKNSWILILVVLVFWCKKTLNFDSSCVGVSPPKNPQIGL
jgi:hypothetical protein